MTTTEGYSGLEANAQQKVRKAWKDYRESIGLEGETYFNLIKAGLSHNQIMPIIEAGKTERIEKIEIWKAIWSK